MITINDLGIIPESCPWCHTNKYLNVQFRQAPNHKTRYGRYDSAVYCRKCWCYGPRVKSEDLNIPAVDYRNESPTSHFRDFMAMEAVKAWNMRAIKKDTILELW